MLSSGKIFRHHFQLHSSHEMPINTVFLASLLFQRRPLLYREAIALIKRQRRISVAAPLRVS